MAMLKRAKDGHLYILGGLSAGTLQIKPAGEEWLSKQAGLPLLGESISLEVGTYRYLKGHDYLHTKGEESYEKSGVYDFAPITLETRLGGPSLLLCVKDDNNFMKYDPRPWMLLLRIDEIGEDGRNVLYQKKAFAVGTFPSDTSSSTTYLRAIRDAENWPEVKPQIRDYAIYYQNTQGWFQLSETRPAAGLRDDWQGNVFVRFDEQAKYPLLINNIWKRKLPDSSISLDSLDKYEGLYWLARVGLDPEWPDPDKALRMGSSHENWQLWCLQMSDDHVFLDDVKRWLWYRQIKLIYPKWHLRLLNPLSFFTSHQYICGLGQPLLLRCDPPTTQGENSQMRPFLSLTGYSNRPDRKEVFALAQSSALDKNEVSYLRSRVPDPNQEYLIRTEGEANGQPLSIRISSQPATRPAWLHGLRCSLTTAKRQYLLEAFGAELNQESPLYQFRVPNDFSLEELASMTWSWQPSEILCSLRWEYLSLQENSSQDTNTSVLKDLKDSTLNIWWHDRIWQTICESPWVQFTLDAASFGCISLKLILKPEQIVNQEWWINTYYLTNFLWLSNVVDQETTNAQQLLSPALQKILLQLHQPDMPATLKSALLRLSSRRSVSAWVQNRLRKLLADLNVSQKEGLVIQQIR
jgi:hypothetical protein